MKQSKNEKNSLDFAFPVEIPSLSKFFIASPVILLDPRVPPRQLRLYFCIAAHFNPAKFTIKVTRERLAKMCGFMSGGAPDVRLVSKLISSTEASEKQCGLGLVQLGYIKKINHGVLQCNEYELTFPPSGTVQFRDPTVVPMSQREDKPVIKSKSERQAQEHLDSLPDDQMSQEDLDFLFTRGS